MNTRLQLPAPTPEGGPEQKARILSNQVGQLPVPVPNSVPIAVAIPKGEPESLEMEIDPTIGTVVRLSDKEQFELELYEAEVSKGWHSLPINLCCSGVYMFVRNCAHSETRARISNQTPCGVNG